MKVIYYLLVLFFAANSEPCFAQAERQASRSTALLFEEHFNRGDFESIFSAFSAEMKLALPWSEAEPFLRGLHLRSGNIIERTFVGYEKSYASYKTNFEKEVLALNIFTDENGKIGGLLIKPFVPINLPFLEKNLSPLILPFNEEWTVVWGGDTKEDNYHVENRAQKNAFDMVIRDDRGLSFRSNGISNQDYYAFGKALIAPCDGEIVLVVDGIKDNEPGRKNPTYVPGNTVILRSIQNEFIVFAHFKQHSIVVRQGQVISQGDLLGLCGNSGNSSEPHLHFHMQNIEDMNLATGAKSYFEKIIVNGQQQQDYSPRRGDRVRNVSPKYTKP